MAKPEGYVLIKYRAVPNMNTTKGGWAPQIEVYSDNPEIAVGRIRGGWEHRGLDKGEALQQAEAQALEERERYCGDWDVNVQWDRGAK